MSIIRNLVIVAGSAAAASAGLFAVVKPTSHSSPTTIVSGGGSTGSSGTGSTGSSATGSTGSSGQTGSRGSASGSTTLNTVAPTPTGKPYTGNGNGVSEGGSYSASFPTQLTGADPADALAVLKYFNELRVQNGTPQLAYDSRLNAVAQLYANEGAARNPVQVKALTNAGQTPIQVVHQMVPAAGATYAAILWDNSQLFSTATPFPESVDIIWFKQFKQIVLNTSWTHFGAAVVINPRQPAHNQRSCWVVVLAKEG